MSVQLEAVKGAQLLSCIWQPRFGIAVGGSQYISGFQEVNGASVALIAYNDTGLTEMHGAIVCFWNKTQ